MDNLYAQFFCEGEFGPGVKFVPAASDLFAGFIANAVYFG